MKKLLFLLFICLVQNTTAQAQATASFTASVTIVQPIGITTTSNMNFAGVDAGSGGLVILTPESTRITQGGVAPKEASEVSAATFEITGEQGYSFSLSLPERQHILSNGSESMIIKDFTSSLAYSDNLQSGSRILKVGATLEVNPNQTPGNYRSVDRIDVTVNYN